MGRGRRVVRAGRSDQLGEARPTGSKRGRQVDQRSSFRWGEGSGRAAEQVDASTRRASAVSWTVRQWAFSTTPLPGSACRGIRGRITIGWVEVSRGMQLKRKGRKRKGWAGPVERVMK